MAGSKSYWAVLTAAINDIAEHGYDSQQRLDYWAEEIRRAAMASMDSMDEVNRNVRAALETVFRKAVDNGGVLRLNPGVSSYTLQRVRPELEAELGRRIAASVDLIKLNRPQAVEKTMQRFRGWASSVPAGGTKLVAKVEQKQDIRKALAQLPYETRRVTIDQSAKLFNNINNTVAENGGAIGALWRSHRDQRGYDSRPDHDAREGKFYVLKSSWAHEAGLIKPNRDGYTVDVEGPGVLPFCKCSWQWIFSLRSVPRECVTQKGEEALREAKRKLAGAR